MLYRFFLALLMLASIAFGPASGARPTYNMEAQEHLNHKTSTSTFTMRVYERRTGKTIWVKQFLGYGNITWSKDHRAVVFETTPAEAAHQNYRIMLVTWIAGQRVKQFSPILFTKDDYTEDFYWSPNKRHLLFRTGSSGASTIDIGKLWCVNLKTHKALPVDSSVRKTQWAGNQKVKYWVVRYGHGSYGPLEPYMFSKPRVWHIPDGF